ncbi:MAG: UDP-N-acetylmuramoyl-tripeptide--D-alanyl-D-alanine ligase [Bacteroidales bacterium]|nr:UDP-N-acetylmuramoyl-tripeptide--D-alanyl-D-alanine ligase [Bacteroidales bacterium]
MEISELYDLFRASKGVNTDTRTIRPGQIFVALKGETFDGNAYAVKALEAGASYAVVNEYAEGDDPRLIRFPDTLQALKELAAFHRQQLGIPVIGLTGTNGKTTTKELIREVLATHFKVAATQGNLNNDIGVPMTVLSIGPDAEIAVVEMGANHPGDIAALTWVSQPTYGLITNVGKAHLLGFGSFEGVKKAKGQLYDWLSDHDGQAFVNVDDENLYGMALERPLSIIPYGVAGEDAEILPTSAENPFLRMSIGEEVLETKLVGAYNAANVMAALAVGRQFGVPLQDGLAAVAAYTPSNNRSQMTRTERNVIIEDAYNANPSSMAAALDNFALLQADCKIVMLGDMRELGEDSVKEHVRIVEKLAGCGLTHACLVGEEFKKALAETGTPSFVKWFATSDELAAALAERPLSGATVLVKGSNSIRMGKVVPTL